MDFIISKEEDGMTVKEFIIKYGKISSKQLTRLKKNEQGILINGYRVTVRALLKENDTLTLATEAETQLSENIDPADIPLNILYEDEYYIALNKPPFIPTHPSHNHRRDTLANALAYHYKKLNLPFVFRAVNRLDKNTSGIVLFAKNAVAANEFSKLQQNKLITKEYLAITNGVCEDHGIIEGYIRRKEKSIIFREFTTTKTTSDSQYSLTEYKKLANSKNCSLLKINIHTGRTHQIRVHTSYIGHYVIGDELYGNADGEQRQMLHAYSIRFVHPFTEKQTCVIAPLPDDFIKALNKRGITYEQ